MKTACLAAYHVEAYISCLEDLNMSPVLEIAVESPFDRNVSKGVPESGTGLIIPKEYEDNTHLAVPIGTNVAFERAIDFSAGVFFFKALVGEDRKVFQFAIPVEHIISVRSDTSDLVFGISHEEMRFIKPTQQPKLRLVK